MKRQIKELRRVLLAIEDGHQVFHEQEDPIGVYHVFLLHDGGFIHQILDGRGWDAFDIIVSNPGLTGAGCDLLDQLRDEGRVDKAQDWLESEGFDRDHLALCQAWLERDMAERISHEGN